MLAIRLPDKIEERLEQLAKRTGRTKAYYVRQAVVEHLQDLEDVEVADKRMANLRAGKTRTVFLAQVLSRHAVGRKSLPTSSSRKPRNGSGKN
jgi:RHH-type transcriptional regulator, rel operon repressor / antitoxin RelB